MFCCGRCFVVGVMLVCCCWFVVVFVDVFVDVLVSLLLVSFVVLLLVLSSCGCAVVVL